MHKFTRTFYTKKNSLKYIIKPNNDKNEKEIREYIEAKLQKKLNNCHWGQSKLFFSELEFLLLCSKYVNINECLVLYIGAADGYRLKHLFMKYFFPDISMLLYDPNPFFIEESEQIIIKTGKDGFFTDDKVEEVLKIANGRKILYISDIRISDDDFYSRENIIYGNILEQQRWGIMMDAEFMLLKFRMFFYEKDYREIDFIDNTYVEDPRLKDKIIYKKDNEKHKDKTLWMLHLKGHIYSQILAGSASAETRLFVKKIKYYSNAKDYKKEDLDKYELKYFNNIDYESRLNYYNLKIRTNKFKYHKSIIYSNYMPKYENTYENVVEYYLFEKFLIYNKSKPSIKNILELAYICYTFFNTNYKNNIIVCIPKAFSRNTYQQKKDGISFFLTTYKDKIQKQFDRIKKIKSIDSDIIDKFINSYDIDKKITYGLFEIKNGEIKDYCNKSISKKEYIDLLIEEYKVNPNFYY